MLRAAFLGAGGSSPRSFDCVSTGVAWRATGPWALGAGRARRLPRRAWRRPLTRGGDGGLVRMPLGQFGSQSPRSRRTLPST